jgi:hypothetical protein
MDKKNIQIGDFKKLSDSKERLPYMRTPYYFDEKFILQNKEILQLVRDFGDKVFLANFIKNNGLEHLLPNNTYVFMLGDNLQQAKKEAINRFNNRQSFILKA